MSSSALIMILATKISVAAITFYFLLKVLKTPPSIPKDDDLDYPRGG